MRYKTQVTFDADALVVSDLPNLILELQGYFSISGQTIVDNTITFDLLFDEYDLWEASKYLIKYTQNPYAGVIKIGKPWQVHP
jgi:hypothetical protein